MGLFFNRTLEKDESKIKHAIEKIEEAYSMAQALSHQAFEPSMITMHKESCMSNSRGLNFSVVIYTNSERYNENYINDFVYTNYCGWKTFINEFGNVCLEGSGFGGICCSWNKFNKAVWTNIIQKHPSWKIDKIREDKSVLRIN